jgi:hypothetical protein
MSNGEETIFGNEEWDDLSGGLLVRVYPPLVSGFDRFSLSIPCSIITARSRI